MKNVRKDVMEKLASGLSVAKSIAALRGASIPKVWHYSTKRADHWITEDENGIYYNSEYYDGSRRYTEKMKGDKRK